MNKIKTIKNKATRLGACSLVGGADSLSSLIALFFSPQGIEFCTEHNFPSLADFRGLDKAELSEHGVYADFGRVARSNEENIALIGETQGELAYSGVERKYTVILMHGAEATIKARNHAVIEVVSIGCKVNYDIDKTVVLL